MSPEPWPSRVDAFMTACAMHAGQRESDLITLVKEFGEGISAAAQSKMGGWQR